jgi:hypothetical protein
MTIYGFEIEQPHSTELSRAEIIGLMSHASAYYIHYPPSERKYTSLKDHLGQGYKMYTYFVISDVNGGFRGSFA